jgi:5'-3' exonuclease
MGVPGFFLWLWKNYKSTNFVFNQSEIDKINIEYFLLDMNCMIHPICFETLKNIEKDKSDTSINMDKIENKMINNVIEYLEKMITIVKPTKCIYIAIDGVAPVAKMKQQRLRRFKSINDKKVFDSIKYKHKKEIPFFWNNSAITPGTQFMKKITDKIKGWASEYAKNNKIQIIFSPANVPGEGEHKLLQYMKENRDSSYVVYGLDADLIFLMLATKLNNIYLMREANNLDYKESKDKINFVSIDIMKTCIINSINKLKPDSAIIINDRIIDDFIFICYLMGNDFLPHIPCLDIYNNAIDTLLETYVEEVVMNEEYIIQNNNINKEVFYKFLSKLATLEEQTLIESYSKKKKKMYCQHTDPYDIEMFKIENLQFKIEDNIRLGEGSMTEWRDRFYYHNYHVKDDIDEFVNNMVKEYMIGLNWVTLYYFDKCPSWEWFYPYDHSPFLNDMVKSNIILDNNPNDKRLMGYFDIKQPLTAFEQLLIVLPKETSYLLPKELRKIMNNTNSSVCHLYPDEFKLDMINKKKYWMCTPILPNLEINLIKKVFVKYSKLLNEDNIKMNKNGENIIIN